MHSRRLLGDCSSSRTAMSTEHTRQVSFVSNSGLILKQPDDASSTPGRTMAGIKEGPNPPNKVAPQKPPIISRPGPVVKTGGGLFRSSVLACHLLHNDHQLQSAVYWDAQHPVIWEPQNPPQQFSFSSQRPTFVPVLYVGLVKGLPTHS